MKTNVDFNRAGWLTSSRNPRLGRHSNRLLRNGAVLVTQGFVGSDSEGRTTTRTRGSDHSLPLLLPLLTRARFKSGLMSTDNDDTSANRSRATQVKSISPGVAASWLTGAKVLHPSTLQPAMARDCRLASATPEGPRRQWIAIARDQVA
jgi:aspartate kinase